MGSGRGQARRAKAGAAPDLLCPHCGEPGPFSHLLEVKEAIPVEIVASEDRYSYQIPEDAESRQITAAEGGFLCESCGGEISYLRELVERR